MLCTLPVFVFTLNTGAFYAEVRSYGGNASTGHAAAYADTVSNVNLSSYVDADWSTEINGAQIVAAPTTGSTGTGIKFADYNGSTVFVGQGASTSIITGSIPLNASAVVNTLLNTYYGATTTEAVLTFTNSAAQTASYSLVADQTIRDYNNDGYPNGLQGHNSGSGLGAVTAQDWWNNGTNGQRLDVQSFMLPSSWAGTGLLSVTLTNPNISGADDILSALQVDDVSATPLTVTPEPSSLMLLATGSLCVLGAVRRRFC